MWTKICANTTLGDAMLAAELGADAVGFIFAPSKRRTPVARAAAITSRLPETVERIGVFATAPGGDAEGDRNSRQVAAEIASMVRAAGLTGAQLHGPVDRVLVEELTAKTEGRTRLLQVVAWETAAEDAAAAEETFRRALAEALALPGVSAVLLDAAAGGASGGLGLRFDWDRAAGVVREMDAAARGRQAELPRLIVAGGLNAGNVAQAIEIFQPDGVDVASGVEARPGVKDPEKLRAFLAAARGA